MKEQLSLYVDSNHYSPYAMSVFVALKEKNILFQEIEINLEQNEHLKKPYSDVGISMKVPCLTIGTASDSTNIFESTAITEYLEEKFPPPIFPSIYPIGLEEKTVCRSVQAWIRSDLEPIKKKIPSSSIFNLSLPIHFSEIEGDEIFWSSVNKLINISNYLIKREWLTESWTIADFDLALMLMRLKIYEIALPNKLDDFLCRAWDRESVASWLHKTGLD